MRSSSISSSNSAFYIQAAILLNNIAVSLVERRLYQEAMETLHNSILVLSAMRMHRQEDKNNDDQRPLLPAEVEHKCYRASLYLSSDAESDHPPTLVALEEAEADLMHNTVHFGGDGSFSICNQYGQLLESTARLICQKSSFSQDYLIYFQETMASTSEDDHQDNTTTCTICALLLTSILHNQGQCCRCLALLSRQSKPQVSERLLDKADELIFLSRQAVAKQNHAPLICQRIAKKSMASCRSPDLFL